MRKGGGIILGYPNDIKVSVNFITRGKFSVKKPNKQKQTHTNTVLPILGEIIAILTEALEGANTVNAMSISAQLTIYCRTFINI